MPSKGKLITAASILAAVMMVAGCGTGQGTTHTAKNKAAATLNLPVSQHYSGPVVATYNGGKLTKEEFTQQYNLQVVLPKMTAQESKTQFLQSYVLFYKYMYGKAVASDKTPVNVAQAKQLTDQYLKQLVGQQYKTQADLDKEMKTLGVTKADYITLAEKGQVLQDYLQQLLKNVKVSDADAKSYYNAHKLDYLQVTVSEILLKTKAQANTIIAELKKDDGKNFAALANKYSQDPGVKTNHGTYANSMAGQFVPHFAEACVTLPIGKIGGPVKTRYGYFAMRVDARKQLPFSQVESSIKQQLLQPAQNAKEQSIIAAAKKALDMKMTVKAADL